MISAPNEPTPSPGRAKTGAAAERSFGRAANWMVGAAAAVLVIVSIGGYFYHREQLSAIAVDHMRLVVTGPSSVRAGVGAEYMVSTTSIGGQPLPAEIEVAVVSPEGKRLKASREPVDDCGRLHVVIPGDLCLSSRVALKVAARCGESREKVEMPIRVEPVHYIAQTTTDRWFYRPGDTVFYRIVILDAFTMTADPQLPIHVEFFGPDGSALPGSSHDATAERGMASGKLVLPATSAEGRYSLMIHSLNGLFSPQEQAFFLPEIRSTAKKFPKAEAALNTSGSVQVSFYPEGGELVAGLENRVYFIARDSLGKPISLSGRIVVTDPDDAGHDIEVASVETAREGLGVFSLMPRADKTYRLKIADPELTKGEPELPKASAERNVVLSTGSGVFAAGKPLEFNIRAAKAGQPLVAVAYCRDVQVGQQPLVTKAGASGANAVAIPLGDAVAGAIRLVVYDYGVAPPRPVAERLVYRRPARKLKVRIGGLKARYAPGETAELSLSVVDEEDKPMAAALGVDVVGSSGDKLRGPSLPAYFLLTSRIAIPEGFSMADFDFWDEIKDGSPTAAELDLLLGVQSPSIAEDAPPLMFDNLAEIRAKYEKNLTDYQADRTRMLDTLTTVSFLGGMGLVLLVAMLGLMRIVSGIHLWVAAIGATTCCLIIGAILSDPGRLASGQDAAVSFASCCETEKRPPDHSPTPSQDRERLSVTLRDAPRIVVIGAPNNNESHLETAYWNPLLIVGPDGKATVRFPLPNVAAKLCVSVDAHDGGRLGCGEAEIVVQHGP